MDIYSFLGIWSLIGGFLFFILGDKFWLTTPINKSLLVTLFLGPAVTIAGFIAFAIVGYKVVKAEQNGEKVF